MLKNQQNIYNSLKYLMIFGQCLGLLPLNLGTSETTITFEWNHWKIVYCFAVICFTLFALIVCVLHLLLKPYDFNHLGCFQTKKIPIYIY